MQLKSEKVLIKIMQENKIIWIIGNTQAGKTTFAKKLIKLLGEKVIFLDGDQMRQTISKDLGFSKEDREENNLRIARLAKLLKEQGFKVVVATICPYEELRLKIKKITDCEFIYVTGGKTGKEYPFEIPKNPYFIVKGNESTS